MLIHRAGRILCIETKYKQYILPEALSWYIGQGHILIYNLNSALYKNVNILNAITLWLCVNSGFINGYMCNMVGITLSILSQYHCNYMYISISIVHGELLKHIG